MIMATIRVLVPLNKRREMFQTLQSLTESIRNQPGCRQYHFYVEIGNEDSLFVVEEWETRADLEVHLASRDFSVLFGAVNLLHGEEAVEFRVFIPAGGREVIDAVRTRSKIKEPIGTGYG
jgi:quinol monooxygenase YgiN